MLAAAIAESPHATPEAQPLLHFPHGLPGFPDTRCFRLETVPGLLPILRLRALDAPALTFLLVAAPHGGPTATAIGNACRELGLSPGDTLVLFVAARVGDRGALVVNLRAPILIDPVAWRGRQHVLPDPDLPLRAPYRPPV